MRGSSSIDQKFTVHKGATANNQPRRSFAKYTSRIEARNRLLGEGILRETEEYLELIQDHEFNSPSQAASILLASNANGFVEWKDAQGNTLRYNQNNDGHTQPPSPLSPLQQFEDQVRGRPRTTEAEKLVVQRIGQDIFRTSLMEHWHGRCPLTDISDQDLLRASHIIPWSECRNDADRLDMHNGLLLSGLWDLAFDRGLVTFDDAGQPQFSPRLSQAAQAELRWQRPIPLTPGHQSKLVWHRRKWNLE